MEMIYVAIKIREWTGFCVKVPLVPVNLGEINYL